MNTSRLTYQEKPILQVNLNDAGTKNFRIGIRKARAIVNVIDEIKQFVLDNKDEE